MLAAGLGGGGSVVGVGRRAVEGGSHVVLVKDGAMGHH